MNNVDNMMLGPPKNSEGQTEWWVDADHGDLVRMGKDVLVHLYKRAILCLNKYILLLYAKATHGRRNGGVSGRNKNAEDTNVLGNVVTRPGTLASVKAQTMGRLAHDG
jgi:hypothetical protein